MALRRTPDSRPLEPTADDPELEDVSATVKLTLRPPFMQVAGAEAASISDLMDTHITQILGQLLSPARDRYDSVDLGPSSFRFRGLPVVRRDFRVTNDRDMVLAARWLCNAGGRRRSGCVWCTTSAARGAGARRARRLLRRRPARRVRVRHVACGRSWSERLARLVRTARCRVRAERARRAPFDSGRSSSGAAASAPSRRRFAPTRRRRAPLGRAQHERRRRAPARAVARPCSVRLFAHASPPRSDEPRGAVAMRTRLKAHGLTYAAAAAEPMTKDESAPLFSSFTSSSLFGGSKQQVRITSVAPGSGAARAGVRAGDVVLGVGSSTHTPTTEGEFVEALARAFVTRGHRTRRAETTREQQRTAAAERTDGTVPWRGRTWPGVA